MLRNLTIFLLFGALVLSGAGWATTNPDGTPSTAVSIAGGALVVVANHGDANAQGAEVNAKAKDGKTALMVASGKDHREVRELLIKAGAK